MLQDYKHLALKEKSHEPRNRQLFLWLLVATAIALIVWQINSATKTQAGNKLQIQFVDAGKTKALSPTRKSPATAKPNKTNTKHDNSPNTIIFSYSTNNKQTASDDNTIAAKQINPDSKATPKPKPASASATKTKPTEAATLNTQWHTVIIEPGHTLNQIGIELLLPRKDLGLLLTTARIYRQYLRLKPGKRIRFKIDLTSRQLIAISYAAETHKQILLTRVDNKFKLTVQTIKRTSKLTRASGVISSSLFDAGHKAGIPDSLLLQLASVFSWDIDFALDLRKGDKFSILYQEYQDPDQRVQYGNIVAAAITTQGKTWYALRYTSPNGHTGWYTREGLNLKKRFIRTPLRLNKYYAGNGRYHPLLTNKKRKKTNYKGTNYVASAGTPVKSTANGKIIFIGRKRQYGKTVIVRHRKGYTTLYAHLSRFRKHLRRGHSVEQGQVIAYVGKTGKTKTAHLHYQLRYRGRHLDPLNAVIPRHRKLSSQWRQDFKKKTTALLLKLKN